MGISDEKTDFITTRMPDLSPFYLELQESLPKSTGADRQKWASQIVDQNLDLKSLCQLLFCEAPIASRFLWMLTSVGQKHPPKLHGILPHLLSLRPQLTQVRTEASFANYWLHCGIPEENEAEAIDLLFAWLQSAEMNVTTKSRALFVLENLTQKYPDLSNELKICLEDQLAKNSPDFRKRAQKVLERLAQ